MDRLSKNYALSQTNLSLKSYADWEKMSFSGNEANWK